MSNMSSGQKSGSKGGKTPKIHKTEKGHHHTHHSTDHGKSGSTHDHGDTNKKVEVELTLQEKVRLLLEVSSRSEEEVCLALHECDEDLQMASNKLLELEGHGEWEKRVKKKKNRQNLISGGANGSILKSEKLDEVNDPTSAIVTEQWGDAVVIQNNAGGNTTTNNNTDAFSEANHNTDKEQRNYRGGGGQRYGQRNYDNNRGAGNTWKGREKRENDRNIEEGSESKRGGSGGGFRGRGRGRGGGRGGRFSGRNFNNSNSRSNYGANRQQPIDTWDNCWDDNNTKATNFGGSTNYGSINNADNWDDFATASTGTADEWNTEEYQGSLADTKVFTPSQKQQMSDEFDEMNTASTLDDNTITDEKTRLESTVVINSNSNRAASPPAMMVMTSSSSRSSAMGSSAITSNVHTTSVTGGSNTLNAAQTQYLSQLQAQNTITEPTKQFSVAHPVAFHSQNHMHSSNDGSQSQTAANVATNYIIQSQNPYNDHATQVSGVYLPTSNNGYVTQDKPTPSQRSQSDTNITVNPAIASQSQQSTVQPTRTKTQRARVPPPSKIPSSAVEMPGDLNANIGYLDVQFGAMDFMSDATTFDTVTTASEAPITSIITRSLSATTSSVPTNIQTGSITSTSGFEQKTGETHSYAPTTVAVHSVYDSYHSKNTYSTATYGNQQVQTTVTSNAYHPVNPSHYANTQSSYASPSGSIYQSSYPSVSPATSLYIPPTQSNTTPHSNYSSSLGPSNTYGSAATTHQPVNQSNQSIYGSNPVSAYVNQYSTSTAYNTNTSGSSTKVTKDSADTFEVPTVSSSMPVLATAHVTNVQTQSEINPPLPHSLSKGAGTIPSSANPSAAPPSSIPSSASSIKVNSMPHAPTPTGTLVVSTTPSSTSISSTGTIASSGSSTVAASNSAQQISTTVPSKSIANINATTSAAVNAVGANSNNVVSGMPPNVGAVINPPYIMGQVPFFQQPVYSYEDMQLLQQRMPHLQTQYYDMNYQTPTTLPGVRDGSLGASVGGYSLSDGRFARNDNNASPVPASSLSQQTNTLSQGHQGQTILAAGTAPPPYFFTTSFNALAPNYQFGAMYTQLPAAAAATSNPHANTNSNQYPKGNAYGSAGNYGSYDAIGQNQDYTKAAYVTAGQNQKNNVNASSSVANSNDLSAMYGKSHGSLGKVNPYDKQSFHSGTPPPFTGAMHAGQGATGMAPGGTAGYAPQVYIPAMTPHQQQQLSTHLMQQPLHQMDVRHQGRRMEPGHNSGGNAVTSRSQSNNQGSKSGSAAGSGGNVVASGKQTNFPSTYWTQG